VRDDIYTIACECGDPSFTNEEGECGWEVCHVIRRSAFTAADFDGDEVTIFMSPEEGGI
jgi:hypothetical protein